MASAVVGLFPEALLACPLSSVHDSWLCGYVLFASCSELCGVCRESLVLGINSKPEVVFAAVSPQLKKVAMLPHAELWCMFELEHDLRCYGCPISMFGVLVRSVIDYFRLVFYH